MNIASTIKDVARYTGLSIATISKYLNGGNVLEENRFLIQEAIRVLDYKVNEIARGLKTNRSMTIGILLPTLDNIFFTSIISNVEDVLIKNGYSTIICDYREDESLENEKFDFLVNKMVDGIIMVPFRIKPERINVIVTGSIPVVLVDRILKGAECDIVVVDNLNASYNAVENLIVKGHRRIGVICGPKGIYTAEERMKGCFRVFEDYNIPKDLLSVLYGDYSVESGYMQMNVLLDQNPAPTAVFVTNYEMTLGAVMALNERNVKIPDELSFIGFDNLQMARIVKPRMSIVIQPMTEISDAAAGLLLKRLKGEMFDFPSLIRLKAKISEGDSVGQPAE